MDRPPHNYAAASAMAYAQQQRQPVSIPQQQQSGFHAQHQQFPPSVHAPPFLPPHPSQFPYHPHMQQQPPLHHHPPPHAQLLHLQQQQQPPPAFSSHLSPHLAPSPFHGMYDSPPPPAAPPSDPELQKRIDKLIEYCIKNGPEFEAMIRAKQQDNPDYGFLFGGEGHGYYRYKNWLSTRPPGGPYNHPFPTSPLMHPSPNAAMSPSLSGPPINAAPSALGAMGGPQMHQPPFPPFFDQQHHHHHQHPQAFFGHSRPEFDQSFKGLGGPLPSDVSMELNNVLNNLIGIKESIISAKVWFMQRSAFAPALAEAFRNRIFALDDSERQLHIIYLANDILFDSLNRRSNPHELDNEAHAFKHVLGSMLARIYHNPQNKEENQSLLQKILQFWASKEVYDQDTIYALEGEMLGGVPSSFPITPKEVSAPSSDSGLSQQSTNHGFSQWQLDKQITVPNVSDLEHPDKHGAIQQFPNSVPGGAFPGSMPINSSILPASQQPASLLLPGLAGNMGEKVAAYPLFPPGLIPGMVRKMQIGSGVPYSPLSPLDIPKIIPPSTVPPSEILERVSKFFKEIGEVNPSEGPTKSESKEGDYDDYQRDSPIRKGGACIPPPPNLQVDPDTGTFPDGSVERKPGSTGSGRLGLGATADPNEVSQYDDVYSSYRKHRSTNYHSSMSARATTR